MTQCQNKRPPSYSNKTVGFTDLASQSELTDDSLHRCVFGRLSEDVFLQTISLATECQ